MRKNIFYSFLIISIFLLSSTLSAQEKIIYKAPKQISFEGGYRYVLPIVDHSNVLGGNSATNGYGFLFDYAWQLGGLNGKKPGIFLSVPMGYTIMLPDNNESKRVSMLNYGWTIRHELTKNKLFTPFLGYGLLLNTLKIKGTDGGVMGHQTQFELGTNLNTNTRLKYFAKIQYSYTSYPKLEDDKRMHFQFVDVRVGARF
ncbi:MAG TPA: hypothetical protein P5084_11535 [Paludibacter sp.]|nr:hypothetical protein [Paludibacter sp.]